MKKICIAGGGPAGIMAAVFASKNPQNQIFIFDKGIILNTLLPTGGGRCNLAYDEYNFKELAKFYPRGEKFLYSVFSRFSTKDTLEFFKNIGIKTYVQDDSRIFPVSDSAKDVKQALLKQIDKKNIKKVFEKIETITKNGDIFLVKTDKNTYKFDAVIIACGGRGNGQKLAKGLGHTITELKPSLCAMVTKEKDFASVSGISLKNVRAEVFFENKKVKIPANMLTGDILFTHKGVSGPLVYRISSYCAYFDFDKQKPLKIIFNLTDTDFKDFDDLFLQSLKSEPQKEAVNVLARFLPKNLANAIFCKENINAFQKAGQLTKNDRQKISKSVTALSLNIISVEKGEEIVTAGGVDLKEINPKTMESKLIKNLYFCGEVLDIDGLTGGFNLQNCWSTGFIAGNSLSTI